SAFPVPPSVHVLIVEDSPEVDGRFRAARATQSDWRSAFFNQRLPLIGEFGEINPFRHQRLRELAIFATESRALPHRRPEPRVHGRNLSRRLRLPQRPPGFGLEKFQRAADGQIILQLAFLWRSELSGPRFGRQHVGPIQVRPRQPQPQKGPGFGCGQRARFRLNRPFPDAHGGAPANHCVHALLPSLDFHERYSPNNGRVIY
ncbi:MAG: hypothetical protein WC911_11015, partial [Thermoleophilia bacterium]